tara:strand:+ start:271 stop:687 length:417 start_codon:yes stop_codon:yes gene_type:complete
LLYRGLTHDDIYYILISKKLIRNNVHYRETNIMTIKLDDMLFTDKTFNETVFISCDCNCPQCNSEIEIDVEFTCDMAQSMYKGEVMFETDIDAVEAIATDPKNQTAVDNSSWEIRDMCSNIAYAFAEENNSTGLGSFH